MGKNQSALTKQNKMLPVMVALEEIANLMLVKLLRSLVMKCELLAVQVSLIISQAQEREYELPEGQA